jgi:hypothetical protein
MRAFPPLDSPLRLSEQARACPLPNVQEEIRELQRSFNAKFLQVREVKEKEINKFEERLARVAEIQVCMHGSMG